jgi:hypothetical protein
MPFSFGDHANDDSDSRTDAIDRRIMKLTVPVVQSSASGSRSPRVNLLSTYPQ